jgi:hypothetical protein
MREEQEAAPGTDALKPRMKDVLAELERESFKNTVLQELREASKRKSLFQHPAFLLFFGFMLTGGLGTWLTSYWQGKAKQNEQARLAHERAIQQKYEVADQINKAVAESYAGEQVMIGTLSSDQVLKNSKEAAEREGYWKQAARTWVINSLVLRQKLVVNFKDEDAGKLYVDIVDKVEELHIHVREGLDKTRVNKKNRALSNEHIQPLLDEADDIREKTQRLLIIMVKEIHEDEGLETDDAAHPNSPTPPGSPVAAPTSK